MACDTTTSPMPQGPRLPRKTKVDVSTPPSAMSATTATQNDRGCEIVPRLPRETKVDVTKCDACHAKCRGVTRDQAGPSAPPSAMSATPATQKQFKSHAKRPWMRDCATPAT